MIGLARAARSDDRSCQRRSRYRLRWHRPSQSPAEPFASTKPYLGSSRISASHTALNRTTAAGLAAPGFEGVALPGFSQDGGSAPKPPRFCRFPTLPVQQNRAASLRRSAPAIDAALCPLSRQERPSNVAPTKNGAGQTTLPGPSRLGPWVGARVASPQSPILRPGQVDHTSFAEDPRLTHPREGRGRSRHMRQEGGELPRKYPRATAPFTGEV